MHIVSDSPVRTGQLARQLGAALPLDIVPLDTLEPAMLAGRVVIWDVDLSDPATITQTRSKMALAAHRDLQTIFLIDDAARHESTQAWALGATVLLGRGRARSDLPGQVGRLMETAVKQALEGALVTLDAAFVATAQNKALARKELLASSSMLINAITDSGLNAWLNQAWSIDEQTSQHCLLVAGVAAGFAVHLGFSAKDRLDLTHAAMLHDIGKARIPPAILDKPGRLNETELETIRTHPSIGYKTLVAQGYDDERLLDAVLHHHEQLDGSGYPDGLKGGEISDFVRIITLCDIFAALVERRAYKKPLDPIQALDIMTAMGAKLDPDLLRAFAGYVDATPDAELLKHAAR